MRGGIPNIPQYHLMTFRNQTLTGPSFWTSSLVGTAMLYCHAGMITIVSPSDEKGATAGRECQPRRRPAGFTDVVVVVFSGPVFRHRSGRWLASAECQNGARYFGLEVLKAGSGQDLLHLRKVEYMKAVIPETPLTHAAKFQDTSATGDESEDGKNGSRLHNASHLAQSDHGVRKEMKGATTEGGVEKAIFEGKGLHPGTGEMHVGSAFLCRVSCALPKHPDGYVDPEHLLRR